MITLQNYYQKFRNLDSLLYLNLTRVILAWTPVCQIFQNTLEKETLKKQQMENVGGERVYHLMDTPLLVKDLLQVEEKLPTLTQKRVSSPPGRRV